METENQKVTMDPITAHHTKQTRPTPLLTMRRLIGSRFERLHSLPTGKDLTFTP